MGTLRKLGQALGLIRRDKTVKAQYEKHHAVNQKKSVLSQIKEAVAEELKEPPRMKKWHRAYEVPGAFGLYPQQAGYGRTGIAICKKMYRNRHGKHIKGVI